MPELICSRCSFSVTTGELITYFEGSSGAIETFSDVGDFPKERRALGEKPGMMIEDFCLSCKMQIKRIVIDSGGDSYDERTTDRTVCPRCSARELISQSPGPVTCPSCGKGTLLLQGHIPLDDS